MPHLMIWLAIGGAGLGAILDRVIRQQRWLRDDLNRLDRGMCRADDAARASRIGRRVTVKSACEGMAHEYGTIVADSGGGNGVIILLDSGAVAVGPEWSDRGDGLTEPNGC